ncbi:MAG: RDD family protein [Jiangellales bacterium]
MTTDPVSPADGPVPEWATKLPHEARSFQGQRAGIVTRLAANIIDLIVTLLMLGGLYVGWASLLFVVSPTSFSLPPIPFVLILIGSGLLLWGQFTLAWATTGRTTGGRVMGLRVVNFRGGRLRWGGAALRAAFCLGFMPGLFWCVISRENRSVQDLVMRTSVIYDWTTRARPDAD